MFTLAHLSDLHVTSPLGGAWPGYLNKRLLGLLSWGLRRHRLYRTSVAAALLDDLASLSPDHIAVTGDITNLGLEKEFREGLAWLRRLGTPADVTVVPGNHDCYLPASAPRFRELWAAYTAGDAPRANGGSAAPPEYPFSRVRGEVALVGVDSAVPSPPGFATGRVGRTQLERLEVLLGELGARGLFRVVLVHHPPSDRGVKRRKRLVDSGPLRDVLARAGAELVLCGHRHVRSLEWLEGPGGGIPAAGAPAASYAGQEVDRRARYYVYRIRPAGEAAVEGGARRHAVEVAVRVYDRGTGRFRQEDVFPLERPR